MIHLLPRCRLNKPVPGFRQQESDVPRTLQVVHDEAAGFWTGKPWLVIDDESKPPIASFKHDDEALGFVDEQGAVPDVWDQKEKEIAMEEEAPELDPERWDGMS
jgi:hypothetical protein